MTCPCGQPLPDVARLNGDPYCSRACAMDAHGVDFQSGSNTPTARANAYGGKPAGDTPRQRLKLEQDAAHRARVKADIAAGRVATRGWQSMGGGA